MSNTKQTAVSWLVNQILKEGKLLDLDIEAAKQMEREQIENALCDGADIENKEIAKFFSGLYYENTYGKH